MNLVKIGTATVDSRTLLHGVNEELQTVTSTFVADLRGRAGGGGWVVVVNIT